MQLQVEEPIAENLNTSLLLNQGIESCKKKLNLRSYFKIDLKDFCAGKHSLTCVRIYSKSEHVLLD